MMRAIDRPIGAYKIQDLSNTSHLRWSSGRSGVGGFYNTTIPTVIAENKAMVFEFGGNGFFGYSSGGPTSAKQLMWWSTFETSSLPDTKDVDPRDIKHALIERHEHCKDPIVQDTVRNVDVESIYPTWTMPELPHLSLIHI